MPRPPIESEAKLDKPTSDEIRTFLGAFDRLSAFEAQTRMVRGYGAFTDAEVPIPACVKVIDYLKALAAE